MKGELESYPTRSANDPPPVKEAVGESGHPLNCHFIGSNLIPPPPHIDTPHE